MRVITRYINSARTTSSLCFMLFCRFDSPQKLARVLQCRIKLAFLLGWSVWIYLSRNTCCPKIPSPTPSTVVCTGDLKYSAAKATLQSRDWRDVNVLVEGIYEIVLHQISYGFDMRFVSFCMRTLTERKLLKWIGFFTRFITQFPRCCSLVSWGDIITAKRLS